MKAWAAQLCLTLCDHVDCSSQASLSLGILQAGALEWVAIPSPGDLPNPGIEPGSPALQADSLPSEPPGKIKNPEVCCHALLQGIFLTQESNQFLLLFSCSVVSNSLWPHRLQHTRLPCFSPSPGACSNSCPLSRWRHSHILSSPSPPAFTLSQHQGLF